VRSAVRQDGIDRVIGLRISLAGLGTRQQTRGAALRRILRRVTGARHRA
jgi:hypothetical protein